MARMSADDWIATVARATLYGALLALWLVTSLADNPVLRAAALGAIAADLVTYAAIEALEFAREHAAHPLEWIANLALVTGTLFYIEPDMPRQGEEMAAAAIAVLGVAAPKMLLYTAGRFIGR